MPLIYGAEYQTCFLQSVLCICERADLWLNTTLIKPVIEPHLLCFFLFPDWIFNVRRLFLMAMRMLNKLKALACEYTHPYATFTQVFKYFKSI